MLDLLGFRPQLFECIDCGEPILPQGLNSFHPGWWYRVSTMASSFWRSSPIEKDVLRYFRHLQRSKWGQVADITMPSNIETKLAHLIEGYLTYLLERKLNSPDFLREIRDQQKDQPKQ